MSEENMNEEAVNPETQETPVTKNVSTFRLVATLAVAGTLAGLLIVMLNQHTKPIIDKYKAEQLQKQVGAGGAQVIQDLFNGSSGELTVTNSTVSRNFASEWSRASGAGVCNFGMLSLMSSTAFCW